MTEVELQALQKAIDNGDSVGFDYVSASFEVKKGKVVLPKEVKLPYLWAEDKGSLKRYLLDGIQGLKIIVTMREV